MRFHRFIGTVLLALYPAALSYGQVTVFTAQQIRTMEPALPTATAVAVEQGRVVAVGSLETLQPIIALRGGRVDHRFANDVIVPGFIDPHIHPSLPAPYPPLFAGNTDPVPLHCPR